MSRMAERAALIEDVENLLVLYEFYVPGATVTLDIAVVIQALRDLRSVAYVRAMPETQRCPIIGELMGNTN